MEYFFKVDRQDFGSYTKTDENDDGAFEAFRELVREFGINRVKVTDRTGTELNGYSI